MYRFILWLIPAVEKFPRSQTFLLGDRIQSTALDVLERLVEATYTKSKVTGAPRGEPHPRILFLNSPWYPARPYPSPDAGHAHRRSTIPVHPDGTTDPAGRHAARSRGSTTSGHVRTRRCHLHERFRARHERTDETVPRVFRAGTPLPRGATRANRQRKNARTNSFAGMNEPTTPPSLPAVPRRHRLEPLDQEVDERPHLAGRCRRCG